MRSLFFFNFILFFKLYIILLVLPNIKMNPPQVYMCSPSWTLLPPPSLHHPSGSSQGYPICNGFWFVGYYWKDLPYSRVKIYVSIVKIRDLLCFFTWKNDYKFDELRVCFYVIWPFYFWIYTQKSVKEVTSTGLYTHVPCIIIHSSQILAAAQVIISKING